jgi:hypothetical protein
MPNRILKDTIWTSPNLNKLTTEAELFFYRLLPLPDDHGCFAADPHILKGRLFPFKHDWTSDVICRQLTALVNNDIIALWVEDNKLYGIILNFAKHQRIRSLHNRKTPEPKIEIYNNQQVIEYLSSIDSECRQVSSTDRSNPLIFKSFNPLIFKSFNPIKDLVGLKTDETALGDNPVKVESKPTKDYSQEDSVIPCIPVSQRYPTTTIKNNSIKTTVRKKIVCDLTIFEELYFLHPKHVAKEDAKKAWIQLNPDDVLIETIRSSLKAWLSSDKWSDTQFVPAFGVWLRNKRWTDEIPKYSVHQSRGQPNRAVDHSDWDKYDRELEAKNKQENDTWMN